MGHLGMVAALRRAFRQAARAEEGGAKVRKASSIQELSGARYARARDGGVPAGIERRGASLSWIRCLGIA